MSWSNQRPTSAHPSGSMTARSMATQRPSSSSATRRQETPAYVPFFSSNLFFASADTTRTSKLEAEVKALRRELDNALVQGQQLSEVNRECLSVIQTLEHQINQMRLSNQPQDPIIPKESEIEALRKEKDELKKKCAKLVSQIRITKEEEAQARRRRWATNPNPIAPSPPPPPPPQPSPPTATFQRSAESPPTAVENSFQPTLLTARGGSWRSESRTSSQSQSPSPRLQHQLFKIGGGKGGSKRSLNSSKVGSSANLLALTKSTSSASLLLKQDFEQQTDELTTGAIESDLRQQLRDWQSKFTILKIRAACDLTELRESMESNFAQERRELFERIEKVRRETKEEIERRKEQDDLQLMRELNPDFRRFMERLYSAPGLVASDGGFPASLDLPRLNLDSKIFEVQTVDDVRRMFWEFFLTSHEGERAMHRNLRELEGRLEDAFKDREYEAERFEADKRFLLTEMDKTRQKSSFQAYERLEYELNRLQTEQQSKITFLENSRNQLEADLARSRSSVEDMKRALQEVQEARKSLQEASALSERRHIQEVSHVKSEYEKMLAELRLSIEKLQTEITGWQSRYDFVFKELNDIPFEQRVLASRLSDTERKMQEVLTENEFLRKTIDALKSQLDSVQSGSSNLAAFKKKASQMDRIKEKHIQALTEEKKKLQAIIDELRASTGGQQTRGGGPRSGSSALSPFQPPDAEDGLEEDESFDGSPSPTLEATRPSSSTSISGQSSLPAKVRQLIKTERGGSWNASPNVYSKQTGKGLPRSGSDAGLKR